MIYVDGIPFSSQLASSSSQGGEYDTLLALLENPILASVSAAFSGIPEQNYSISKETESQKPSQRRCVYIFQREYATVDPDLVDFVGTDEATTCVGLVIRNRRSGMTSIAHMDSPKVVDIGLMQMLTLLVDKDSHDELDVHLVGGFDDASYQQNINGKKQATIAKPDGYSFPLCAKIILSLQKSRRSFNIQTFHVLGNNTRWDAEGHPVPIFHGFLVDTSSGSVMPTTFDRSTRCPDELIRRIRVSASFEDPRWKGRLLDTYDTQTDKFVIAPCSWSNRLIQIAKSIMSLSDSDILSSCSTSPFAESPDFVDNERSFRKLFMVSEQDSTAMENNLNSDDLVHTSGATMNKLNANDPLFVHSSDNPGTAIVPIQLNRANFWAWSQVIKIALGAKLKLGFITGECVKPNEEEDPERAELWERVDCLVRSWIFNSISKELLDAFLFAPTAKDLWDRIQQRYGQKNNFLLYQLQREISMISQGNSSLEAYFTKLMKLQNEMLCCSPVPICHCEAKQQIADRMSSTSVMQFLMGLNETYDQVRNQILVMEPLPSIDKVYSMLLTIERQRQVHVMYHDKYEDAAMYSRSQTRESNKFSRKGKWIKKNNERCTHCNLDGHLVENCFKLYGYPEWYKGKKDQKVQRSTNAYVNYVRHSFCY